MPLPTFRPIRYLITSGATSVATTPSTEDFHQLLEHISRAVDAGIHLIQIREKSLSARVLFELTLAAAKLTRGSGSRLLVNDRADIARTAGADGVHLTTTSVDTDVVRRTFGRDFLIGVSTHSVAEAQAARNGGADFAVFGPVFPTRSKEIYGEPLGLKKLEEVARELNPFPILALGGVTVERIEQCLSAGATGVAGISLFENLSTSELPLARNE